MIVLEKGQTNEDLVFTLSENTTLSNPVYLFQFISPLNVGYTCISTDLATTAQKERYNKFTIIEGVDDRENGSLILGGQGVYELVIWEQSSATNLDPDNATGRVEQTLVRLIGTSDSTTDYIEHVIETSYIEHTV